MSLSNTQLPQPGTPDFDQRMRLVEAQIAIERIAAMDRSTAATQAQANATQALVDGQAAQTAAITNAPYTAAVQAHAAALQALATALGGATGHDAVIAAHVRGIAATLSHAPEA